MVKNRVVTSFCRLLRGMTSNHHGEFNCLNCYHSHSTETRLKNHEELCNEYDHCYTKMPTEDGKILKYKHGEKSLKAPFLISFDNEVLLPKMSFSQDNPNKSQTEKKAEYIPSGCAWSLTCSFDSTKNKYGYFRSQRSKLDIIVRVIP